MPPVYSGGIYFGFLIYSGSSLRKYSISEEQPYEKYAQAMV